MDTSTDRLLAKGEREALAQYDRDQPTAELTRNPVDGSWGYICTEHGLHRGGLTEAHALNVERKHLREDHPDPLLVELDLKAAAEAFLHHNDAGSMSVWRALTGLKTGEQAKRLAEELAKGDRIPLAVAPF
jgi:hypothetical protein